MKRLIFIAAVSGGIAMCACNGDSDQTGGRNVAGIWTGAVTKISDTCGAASGAPITINFTHNVAQNDETVSLTDQTGLSYIGQTLSDDGFSVDGSINPATNCSDTRRVEYQGINADSDPTGSVNFTINRSCSGAAPCEIEYTGTASRNSGGAVATPTATPAPGSTPVASGGCLSVNPNPAAGSYLGDGACGISTTVFRTSGQTVILEPFGANGATSFAVNAANSSTATSNNTDLTVKGEAGYNCSLACSPPGTFSVTCFKEGGTTCNEKF